MGPEQRVLVVGPAWVGDMVMAQSLFITLRQHMPGAKVDVLAPGWSLPLLARMPEVHEAVDLPVGHGELALSARYAIGKQLRNKGYTQAIIIPRSLKAALIPFFARIPRRTGYRGETRYGLVNDMRALDKSVLTKTVQRYVALGRDARAPVPFAEIPQPQLTVDKNNQARLKEKLGISDSGPTAAFVPGAEYGPAKRWPSEYYAKLARLLTDAGYCIWLLGSANDSEVCKRIGEQSGGVTSDLSGKTSLVETVDLIALTDFVVTNDSGLMHVAAAVGRPLLAIFGSSTPRYTPPLSSQAEIFYLDLDCSPCFERQCPLGHLNCLRQITVKAVYDTCVKIAHDRTR
ncbi:MAG: lipopolysaccharide heptosyltransferase II [Acidiferrobacterales bacterium]